MRLSGLSEAEVADLVGPARRGATPGPSCASWRRRSTTSPAATPSSSASCGEPWSRPGRSRSPAAASRVTRPLSELGTPESVREVVSQRLSRLAPKTTDLLELAAVGRLGVRARADRPRRRPHRGRAARRARGGGGSGMIEELPSPRLAYRFTHELVRRALYDRLSRLRRAELHLRVGEALESAGRGLRPQPGRPRPSFRRRRAVRRRRAGDRLQPARGAARRAPRSPSTKRRTACEPRSRSAIEDERRARRGAARARRREPPGRQGDRRAGGVRRGGGDRPRAGRRRAARAGGDRLRGGLLAPGARRAATRSSCSRRRWRRSAPTSGELRIGLLAGLARALDFQGERERGAIVRESAVALAREPGGQRRAGKGAGALLLGAGHDSAGGDPARC